MITPLKIDIELSEKLYLKNPNSSKLGQVILQKGSILMEDIGYEQFTFKKLSDLTQTTETSIYRYFESKQMFLLYILNWYWSWTHYQLQLSTLNMDSSMQKLKRSVGIICSPIAIDHKTQNFNAEIVYKIVLAESSKVYFRKNSEDFNREGLFLGYNLIHGYFAELILEIYPRYQYPKALSSIIIEGAFNQSFFSKNIPELTDQPKRSAKYLSNFLMDLITKTITKNQNL